MINAKERQFIRCIRQGLNVKQISKELNIPKSTAYLIYNNLIQKDILKNSHFVSYDKLGYNYRIFVALKVLPDDRTNLKNHLLNHERVNSVHFINSGYDYHFDAIFENSKVASDFVDSLKEQFEIVDIRIYNVVDTISQEKCLLH